MAKNINDLLKDLHEKSQEIKTDFKPFWDYNKEGDCIEELWEETSFYAERINNSITLYRDERTGRVVGVIFKNVKEGFRGGDVNAYHRGD